MRIAIFLLGCALVFFGGWNWLKSTTTEDKYWNSTLLGAGVLMALGSIAF